VSKATASFSPRTLNVVSLLYFSAYCLLWTNMETLGQFFFWRLIYEKERDAQVHWGGWLALTWVAKALYGGGRTVGP
jgi:hypothetical protein